MKRIFIFILVLLCFQAYSQSSGIIRVPTTGTTFGTAIPRGFNIIDMSTSKQYLVISTIGLAGTETITSSLLSIGLKELTNPDETDPVVKVINGFVISNGTTIQAAVSGSDIKTINSLSLLGAGDIITGDVSKVGTPINNQIGVWTGSGTIKGGTNFTWDGNIQTITGTAPTIKFIDTDFPASYMTIVDDNSGLSFNYNGSIMGDFSAYGFRAATLQLISGSSYSNTDGMIRYDGTDFFGRKAGTWVSLTAGGSSGMTNPMTTRGDLIYASATGTPGTPSSLPIGSSGQILTVVSGIPSWQNATSGSTQWTTDTYGITYGSNIGLGVASGGARLAAQSSTSGQFTGTFYNSSSTGSGLLVLGGNTTESSLIVKNYAGAVNLNVTGDGSVFMPRITNTSQAYVLGYDASIGSITYFATPSGGGGGTTNLTYTSATTYGRVNSSTGSYATIPAVTTSIAGLMTTTNLANLNSAYGWGNHAGLYVPTGHDGLVSDGTSFAQLYASDFHIDNGYWRITGKQSTLVSGTNLKKVSGNTLLGSGDISTPLIAPINTSFTLNASTSINAKISTNASITITISNLSSGSTGNIEVTYTGTATVTFYIPSMANVYLASNIYQGGSYTSKSVLSKSTGTAVYSYYCSGSNCYITGTQTWN